MTPNIFAHARRVAFLALITFATLTVSAQTATFTNLAGGDWNTPVNWDVGIVPGPLTNAVIGIANTVNYNSVMTAPTVGGVVVTNGSILNINNTGFNVENGTTVNPIQVGWLTGRGTINVNNGAFLTVSNSGSVLLNTNAALVVSPGGVVLITNSLSTDGLTVGPNKRLANATNIASVTIGGTVTVSGRTTIAGSTSGNVGSRVIVTNGGVLNCGSSRINNTTDDGGQYLLVAGGTANLGNFSLNKSVSSGGLIVSNGVVNATAMQIGIDNSQCYATIYGGALTNTGTFTICDRTNGATSGTRSQRFLIRGGTVVSTGAGGIVVANQANNGVAGAGVIGGILDINAGTLITEGITLVKDNTLTNAWATLNLSGAGIIYLGSGGLVGNTNTDIPGTSGYTVSFSGGTLAAKANYSIAANMNLSGSTATFQAADAGNNPFNIAVNGVLSGGGQLIKTGGGTLTLGGANTYSGSTRISQGVLALGASGSLTSSPIEVGSNTVFDVNAVSGGYTLAASKTLSGWGGINGNVSVASEGIIDPGTNNAPGTLTFSNSVTQTGGAKTHFDLSTNPSGPNNDLVVVREDLNISGVSNIVEISGGGPAGSVHPLFKYYGNFNGNLTNFTVKDASGVLTNDTSSTPKMVAFIVAVTVRGPTNIVWVGNAAINDWDALNITNWLNNGALDFFVSKDNVLFGSAGAANPNVNIPGSVLPNSITVDAASDYTFSGSGSIGGVVSIIKTNTGRLTIDMTNAFSGSVSIKGGTLSVATLADNNSPSPIGESATVLVDGGTLEYSGPSYAWTRSFAFGGSGGGVSVSNAESTLTCDGTLTGTGSLIKSGDGGLILNVANSYSGGTIVNAGLLTIANASGAGTNTVTLNGGSLAIGAVKPANTIIVAKDGVISGGNTGGLTGIRSVTGSSNLTIAVTTGVFDLMGDMSAYSGTITLSNAGGSIVRLNGTSGSQLATWDLGTGTMDLNIRTSSASNNIGALMGGASTTLSGRSASDNQGPTTHYIGANGQSTTFDGLIQNGSYPAQILSIAKVGGGTLTLSGANTYTGSTSISNGVLALTGSGLIDNSTNINISSGMVLDVSGRTDGTLNLGQSAAQTLRGAGTINGSLNVGGSGIVSPGSSIGTLTVTNIATLGGTAWMEINRADVPNADKLVAPAIALGGTLVVTNTGAELQVGDSFDLFDGTLSGTFAGNVVLPNYYTWDTSNLETNGTIKVASVLPAPTISSVDFSMLSSGYVTFNAINGAPNGAFDLLTSTDVALPLASWSVVSSGTFDSSGNLSGFVVTVDPNAPQQFYVIQAY